ncbi:MAG: AAA family ATPase [Candidatus Omnitrophota bacterium]
MINNRIRKAIIKVVALVLIQGVFALNTVCAGEINISPESRSTAAHNLSPKLQVSEIGLQQSFDKVIAAIERTKTPRVKSTSQSSRVRSASKLFLVARMLIMLMAPMQIIVNSSAFAEGPSEEVGQVLPQRPPSLADLTKILQSSGKRNVQSTIGEIKTDLNKQKLGFKERSARARVEAVNAWINELWEQEYSKNTLDPFITKRGNSEEAVAIGKALLLIQIASPETFDVLKQRNVSLFMSNIPGAGMTRGARGGGRMGKPLISMNKAYKDNTYWLADILVHESVHAERIPQNLWQLISKHNLYTFLRNWLFSWEHEEELAFAQEAKFAGKFNIKPKYGETFVNSIELVSPYYNARWQNLGDDLIGAILFNFIPLIAVWYLAKWIASKLERKKPARNRFRNERVRENPVREIDSVISLNTAAREKIKELEEIVSIAFSRGQEQVIIAIDGASGTGKTTLAKYIQAVGIAGLNSSQIQVLSRDDYGLSDAMESAFITLQKSGHVRKLVIVEGHGLQWVSTLAANSDEFDVPHIFVKVTSPEQVRLRRLHEKGLSDRAISERMQAKEPSGNFDIIIDQPFEPNPIRTKNPSYVKPDAFEDGPVILQFPRGIMPNALIMHDLVRQAI